jgi:hypothetical protein
MQAILGSGNVRIPLLLWIIKKCKAGGYIAALNQKTWLPLLCGNRCDNK